MNSRESNSLAASRRSQSVIWRCTSGSDVRRRSGRGEKGRRGRPERARSCRCSPLLPHQETVRQHHGHRMAVEARPQSALVLVPAQQPLGLLMILLHPVPPMGVLHQPLQRHIRPEVAPIVPPLAIGGILADQPARSASPRRGHPPGAEGDELGRASSPGSPPATSPSATTAPAGPRSAHRPAGTPRRAARADGEVGSGRRPRSAVGVSPGRPGSWGYRRSRHRRSRRPTARPRTGPGPANPRRSAAWSGRRPPRGPWPCGGGRHPRPRARADRAGWRPARRSSARHNGN